MPELVRDDSLRPFVVRKLVGIASNALGHADLHGAGGQQLLEASLADVPRGETVIGDQRRSFCVGYCYVRVFQRFPIQGSKIAAHRRSRPFARAECLLAADIDRQLGFQLAVVLL